MVSLNVFVIQTVLVIFSVQVLLGSATTSGLIWIEETTYAPSASVFRSVSVPHKLQISLSLSSFHSSLSYCIFSPLLGGLLRQSAFGRC